MRRRNVILAVGGVAVFVLATIAVWDALKFGRTVPQLVPPETRATLVIVEKHAHRLTLVRNGDALKAYDVSLGGNPLGHKQQEGDSRTPEGRYAIDFKNPRSRFHLSLRVSYPDHDDRERARRRGVPPGGDIMIHGLPNGLGWLRALLLYRDWTDGCIAVTNAQIEEIWAMIDVGTPVEIRP